jgi:hypothetical protein
MDDFYLLEDGGSIVGDEGFSAAVSDHLIHASGTETGANTIGDGWVRGAVPLAAWMLVVRTSLDFSFLL